MRKKENEKHHYIKKLNFVSVYTFIQLRRVALGEVVYYCLIYYFETRSHNVAQAGLGNPPASASLVLGLQMCTITPNTKNFLEVFLPGNEKKVLMNVFSLTPPQACFEE